ncbi:MAG: alanine dehydrogenase [Halobacteriovoraceae bacterium]|nr:alanine dehydrogenase [Halobacteriovoraceae bacterium]
MNNQTRKLKVIGLAREVESQENPGGLEKRVALTPKDVKPLVKKGLNVFVESGAGDGVGFSDSEYISSGAIIENSEEIYRNKDMVVKFKGPPLDKIKHMSQGTILFCMAHFRSFPERAKLLEKQLINVIAMEEILESPKYISDEIIKSKRFVEDTLSAQKIKYSDMHIGFLGYGPQMVGGIRRAGNRAPKSMSVYQDSIEAKELKNFGESAVYFYDSRVFKNVQLILDLKEKKCQLFDLKEYESQGIDKIVRDYRETHPPFEFGGRKIQCLHETGMAGARYGFQLYLDKSDSIINNGSEVKASVLGYGNVGMGAIHECYLQGVREIKVLGRTHTTEGTIENLIKNSNVIINGAEQSPELRGKNFLIKNKYLGETIKPGSVVVDLVGGSATNRSPVESIIECTYMTNPYFEVEKVYFTALWGWPMMGMMRESCVRYSGQIKDVLIGEEKLINGILNLAPGVKKALVCGPF